MSDDASANPAGARAARSGLVWLAAAAGMLVCVLALHPGQVPFDSAFQLWQARTGTYWNVTPVTMPLLWALLLRLTGEPASLLWLNLALFWSGIALCLDALRGPAPLRALLALACGLVPLSLVQMGHLLSDAHLAAALIFASGLIAEGIARRRRAALIGAVIVLVHAGGIRHNALLATLPLAVILVRALAGDAARLRTLAAGAAVIMLATVALSFALDRTFVVERRTTWPSIVLWDLAAISVEVDRLLLPAFTHGPDLSVAELVETGAFDPTTNTRLFERSRSGIGSGLGRGYAPEQLRDLRAAWCAAVTAHPLAWLRHRARTYRLLAGPAGGEPHGLTYFSGYTRFADNPETASPPLAPAWHAGFHTLAERLRAGIGFSAWPALAALVASAVLAWPRRRQPVGGFALACAASALAYAGGFFFFAPGAELRYLTWPIVLAPLVLAITLLGRNEVSAVPG